MRKQSLCAWAVLTAAMLSLSPAAWADDHDHDHEGDLIYGSTAEGGGDLMIEFHFDHHIELPEVSGLLTGWASDEPGFDGLAQSEPDESFYALTGDPQIQFQIVAIDPALKVYTPGLTEVLDAAGESYTFDHEHAHLTWHIDALDPAFDDVQEHWHLQFQLMDLGGTYGDSPVYTLEFVRIPEPGTLALVLVGLLAVRRR